jgi:hypothetical protein
MLNRSHRKKKKTRSDCDYFMSQNKKVKFNNSDDERNVEVFLPNNMTSIDETLIPSDIVVGETTSVRVVTEPEPTTCCILIDLPVVHPIEQQSEYHFLKSKVYELQIEIDNLKSNQSYHKKRIKNLNSTVHNLNTAIRRNKLNTDDSNNSNLWKIFTRIVKKQSIFKTTYNNQPNQLTFRTNLYVNDLVSNCGVSMEKLPMIITDVLNIYLGPDFDLESGKYLIPSTETWKVASDRHHYMMEADTKLQFNPNEAVDSNHTHHKCNNDCG